MGSDRVSRRRFLGGAVAGVAAGRQELGGGVQRLPERVLGRTGVRVPILGIGCGVSWWDAYKTEERSLEALRVAIDLGITYIDTGQSYGKGLSESWIGKLLKGRRNEVFLATKITVRDGQEALRETERCLKRLQTDHLDLLHIHNLRGADDLARIEARGGLLEAVYKLREQKVTRFIGITSHTDALVLKTALERHDFDCTQMALNAARQGFAGDRVTVVEPSFESLALPAARKKNIGVIAMKVTARGALVGREPQKAEARALLRYALSLPVSIAVVGMSRLEQIRENAELARRFEPMGESEMRELSGRMGVHKVALDRYFRRHADG